MLYKIVNSQGGISLIAFDDDGKWAMITYALDEDKMKRDLFLKLLGISPRLKKKR